LSSSWKEGKKALIMHAAPGQGKSTQGEKRRLGIRNFVEWVRLKRSADVGLFHTEKSVE